MGQLASTTTATAQSTQTQSGWRNTEPFSRPPTQDRQAARL